MKIIFMLSIFVTLLCVVYSVSLNTPESDLRWIRWSSKSKKFPLKSVLGGNSIEGRDLYVIRVSRRDTGEFIYGSCGGIGGKNLNDCFIATESKEQQVFDVEILTGENFVWCAGKEREFDKNFAICRASYHEGTLEPGTWLSNGKCRIGYSDKGVSSAALTNDFEVLRTGSC